jgi:hypothetical protein
MTKSSNAFASQGLGSRREEERETGGGERGGEGGRRRQSAGWDRQAVSNHVPVGRILSDHASQPSMHYLQVPVHSTQYLTPTSTYNGCYILLYIDYHY